VKFFDVVAEIVQPWVFQSVRTQLLTYDSYFNFSEMKLLITSVFSVQIMSYIGASDIIYSDVIDSFISEMKYQSLIIQSLTEKPL